MILFGPWPFLTARKGYQARRRFVSAMLAYFKNNGHESGSALIKARYAMSTKYGYTVEHAARFEVGNLIGVLVNATPSFFWMIVYVFSNAELLADIRDEVTSAITTTSSDENTMILKTINITNLKRHCPLLLSTYQEVLRIQTHGTTNRWVSKDTLLADRYFLKEGSVIQVPSQPTHNMPSIWGSDVGSFNPRRFIKLETKTDKAKQHPASFRSFGGGATLCPERHFAAAEICYAVAMFVMRFNVSPVETKSGRWEIPSWARSKIVSTLPPPAKDIKARIETRQGMEKVEWRFGFEESVEKFEVFAG